MSSIRKFLVLSRWSRAAVGVAALATLVAACSVLLDNNNHQCELDSDCASFGGRPYCQNHLCVASGLGPEGCFGGVPTTPAELANQCSTARCEPFDNCARLGLCTPGAEPPPPIMPPSPDAGVMADASTIDAPAPALPSCVEPGRNVVVVGGSTAVQPLLSIVAPLLAAGSPAYQIAYLSLGSCTGVDAMFSPDQNKHIIKDTPARPALLFASDGSSTPCTFGSGGTKLDVAVSDVFASSCTASYMPGATIAEYLGPVQPMTFVVPSASSEKVISAEMAHVVFGRGNTDAKVQPYDDPGLYFIRNASSGTQQMISRAIEVDARRWWGVDQGGSTKVRDLLKAVAPASASGAIGILSTDFADAERARLRILAFQGEGQLCGYYPDATQFTRDKINVRDGHYSIWGPVHFFAEVSGGLPNAAAAALVTQFTLPRLDQKLLDAIIKSGFVPACAMKVKRTAEMGPLAPHAPEFQCGCYFEANVPSGAAPADCKACNGPADCPSGKPACNNGFCEEK